MLTVAYQASLPCHANTGLPSHPGPPGHPGPTPWSPMPTVRRDYQTNKLTADGESRDSNRLGPDWKLIADNQLPFDNNELSGALIA